MAPAAPRCAARWAEGALARAGGGTGERWREAESGVVEAVVAVCRAACSEALECCSEPTTPAGGTTPRPLWRHLEAEEAKALTRELKQCIHSCILL